ncbi:hypothetical protein NM688_g7509 [Phlebia brevispora]|uniref:Uncharacterized protein n=1 Tax=Phlebia brevispora TaxID=194682 RepID=A0ACC1S4D2_9APHY|nr:hypothetical protein NM688_g7509 [Phlebia brevispora]
MLPLVRIIRTGSWTSPSLSSSNSWGHTYSKKAPIVDYLDPKPVALPKDITFGVQRAMSEKDVTRPPSGQQASPETLVWLEISAGPPNLANNRSSEARSHGEPEGQFKAVEAKLDPSSHFVNVTLFEDRHDVTVPRSLTQHALSCMPIHDIAQDRNRRIKEFYWKLWFSNSKVLSGIDVRATYTSSELGIDSSAVERVCEIVGNWRSQSVCVGRAGCNGLCHCDGLAAVMKATFEPWFRKVSLWADEDIDAIFDRDLQRVCIVKGPIAIKHSKVKDESIKDLLGNIIEVLRARARQRPQASRAPRVQSRRSTFNLKCFSRPFPMFVELSTKKWIVMLDISFDINQAHRRNLLSTPPRRSMRLSFGLLRTSTRASISGACTEWAHYTSGAPMRSFNTDRGTAFEEWSSCSFRLFSRQHSLHKMSMICHRVRLMPRSTFRYPYVIPPSNTRFDGDEMNMHILQIEGTRAELSQIA